MKKTHGHSHGHVTVLGNTCVPVYALWLSRELFASDLDEANQFGHDSMGRGGMRIPYTYLPSAEPDEHFCLSKCAIWPFFVEAALMVHSSTVSDNVCSRSEFQTIFWKRE
ncbi:uncharacterized protein YALI1_C14284g [Yarrowia lipolytica]|uniref:Uncharacterized protein n=1 Tax=Yarrowia lipolytica TaxID=4952 RepID=A0A1D8NAG1_YARLL|nr:hypothetical protein YALI1_C14284g [Yarrowia lipolytica]